MMVPRKAAADILDEPEARRRPAIDGTLAECRAFLSIDRDDLDSCLMEQPEVFYRVAQAFTLAQAERDSIKLDLTEAQAELGVQFRKQALEKEEKLTEDGLKQKLSMAPRIQKLERQLLDASASANEYGALKESFQQRSFMLRELVALKITQRRDEDSAGGSHSGHAKLAQSNREATDRLRRERREQRGTGSE